MSNYKIGQLAKLTNNTVVTVRHYEELGLLGTIKRSPGGFRLYTEETVERLHFINNAKRVGFELDEIKQLLALQSKRVPSARIKKLTQNKIRELEERISTLLEIKNILVEWEQACDGKVPIDKCPILQQLYSRSKQ